MRFALFLCLVNMFYGNSIENECEVLLKLLFQSEVVEGFDENYIYLRPENLLLDQHKICLYLSIDRKLELPFIGVDKYGYYIEYTQLPLVCQMLYAEGYTPVVLCAKKEGSSESSSSSSQSSEKKDKEISKEAEQHFKDAREHLVEALTHAAGAALSIEVMPPLAAVEIWQSSQSFVKMADSYLQGKELEEKSHNSYRSDWNDPNNHDYDRNIENNPYERHG